MFSRCCQDLMYSYAGVDGSGWVFGIVVGMGMEFSLEALGG